MKNTKEKSVATKYKIGTKWRAGSVVWTVAEEPSNLSLDDDVVHLGPIGVVNNNLDAQHISIELADIMLEPME